MMKTDDPCYLAWLMYEIELLRKEQEERAQQLELPLYAPKEQK